MFCIFVGQYIFHQVTVPLAMRCGKLRRTRSGGSLARVASVDRLRTRLGRGGISGGGSDGSRNPKGEADCSRETGRSECRGLNCPSVRSYQTASARPIRSWLRGQKIEQFILKRRWQQIEVPYGSLQPGSCALSIYESNLKSGVIVARCRLGIGSTFGLHFLPSSGQNCFQLSHGAAEPLDVWGTDT